MTAGKVSISSTADLVGSDLLSSVRPVDDQPPNVVAAVDRVLGLDYDVAALVALSP